MWLLGDMAEAVKSRPDAARYEFVVSADKRTFAVMQQVAKIPGCAEAKYRDRTPECRAAFAGIVAAWEGMKRELSLIDMR